METRGLLIVYTGNGKGKTSAALGAAFRAVGSGLKVLMVQFIKGSWHYGELDSAKMLGDAFEIRVMGRGFVKIGAEKPDPEDIALVESAWAMVVEEMHAGRFDMIVCDEITSALDVSVQAAIVDLLGELQRETHVGLLFVTHNLALIRTIAEEIVVMNRGRIVEAGKVDQVLDAPEDDYTKALLADTPSLEAAIAAGGAPV